MPVELLEERLLLTPVQSPEVGVDVVGVVVVLLEGRYGHDHITFMGT